MEGKVNFENIGKSIEIVFRWLLSTTHLRERVVVGPDSSTPWSSTPNLGIRSKTPARESLPDFTQILTTSEDLIRLNDGVPSIKEAGTARLKLHARQDELDHEGIAVLGDGGVGAVEIVLDGGVGGREERFAEAVYLDKALFDHPEHLSPDLADSVHTPVSGSIERLVL